ncbi:MAG: WYL domain-containing protein [Oscillospiraceae bacterium]|nr:WYL domain-containing protein [Oscillospiraceae bacterium]
MDKKTERIIDLFNRLNNGEIVNKSKAAEQYDVNERSILRDIQDLRSYFSNHHDYGKSLIFDKKVNGYRLIRNDHNSLSNSQIFTVCKILLESRALVKEEMMPIIDNLLSGCVPFGELSKVEELISNEKLLYLEPNHGKKFVSKMWNIGSAVRENRFMRIRYQKLTEPDKVMRLIQPVGIMFSEFYFYLIAYISESEDNPDVPKRPFPTIYRIDRIAEYEILKEHYTIPYAKRFQEGEFRKRIQFMFGGELRRIKFIYKGLSIEAILDRFPTAQILDHSDKGWLITAEVYGDGVDMWLRSQGNMVEVIKEK